MTYENKHTCIKSKGELRDRFSVRTKCPKLWDYKHVQMSKCHNRRLCIVAKFGSGSCRVERECNQRAESMSNVLPKTSKLYTERESTRCEFTELELFDKIIHSL